MSTNISDFFSLTLEPHITTVLLDLDNTCYEYEPCHAAGLSAARTLLESYVGTLADFPERYKAAQKRVKSRISEQAASHSRILYFQALLEDLEAEHIYERCVVLEEEYWSVFMKHMVPTPGLSGFLARCQERDTKIVVISDLTTALQCKKLVALGIASYITALVTSEEAGAEKPDARPFTVGLEKAAATVNACVMIGDNPDRDIVGAQTLGISTILFTHAALPQHLPVRQDGHI